MPKIIKNISHEEWLKLRNEGIGASEINIILGLNKYGDTPYKLYRRKMGIDPPIAETPVMREGHDMEPVTAQHYVEMTGACIKKGTETDWLAIDESMPFLRVSPDRLYWREGDKHTAKNLRLLELKCTRTAVDKENFRQDWYAQVQYQMGVMKINHGTLCWRSTYGFDPTYDFLDFKFDPEYYEKIKQAAIEFWCRHIVPKVEPKIMTSEDASLKFVNPKSISITATPEILRDIARIQEIDTIMEANKNEKDLLQMKIKSFIGDEGDSIVTEDKKKVASWKPQKGRQGFNTELLQKEHPDIYKQYVTTGKPSRTLRINKQ